MPKIITRPRLTRDVYSTAEQVAQIITHAEVFPDAHELIGHILCELSEKTNVFLEHPDILRPFLVACARVGGESVYEAFSDLRAACHFAACPAQIRELSARLRHTDREEEGAETPAPAAQPNVVVDFDCYRQSHSRKIHRTVFAEKGGGDE